MIPQELLNVIACPKCKGPVTPTANQDGLICEHCRLIYEIRDGIPIMLEDQAKKLTDRAED